MTSKQNQKTTKELILDAAFSFLGRPNFATFSMNSLAEKVGISKPAIYRHFKNKEALLDAMEELVIENLAEHLKDVASENFETRKKSLASLIEYFSENPMHINYLIAQMSSNPNYEDRLFSKLYDRDLSFVREGDENVYLKKFRSDMARFSEHVFCGMSIFYFVTLRERCLSFGKIRGESKDFADKVVEIILGGLSGTTEGESPFRPSPISDERKRQLLELCKIDSSAFPEENRIFTALASVIEKYKVTGVTVERIAAELQMAKSSLYEYFDNKNEMIKCLINKELQLLKTIIIENTAEAKNFSEYVCILIASEMEYFSHRESIIPICGWLLMDGDGISEHEKYSREISAFPGNRRLPDRIDSPDLGFAYSPEYLIGWIKCLPVAFLCEAKGKSLSEGQRVEGIMRIIDCILNGVGNKMEEK